MTAVFVLLILGLPVSSVTAAVPTLTTPDIAWVSGAANKKSSATDTTARIGANITDIGGFNITAHGTVWKAGSSPVITDNPLDNGAGTLGVFYQNRTGLPAGSQIFFKGYATNSNNDTGLSPDGTFYTEPAAQPTGVTISNINYFSMTVSWDALPADTDGVLVVMQAQRPVNEIPYDGTVYTANAAFGTGNELIQYERDYVVYDGPGTSVDVTNLQAGVIYHVALFAYKGSGTGAGGINYINDFTVATASATTIPTTGFSHNEQNIPAYQTNTGCANCHGSHHTTDVLPRGLAQYNRCFVCHSAGGGANPNIGLHLADGSVDCGTCHTMHSFKTKELYSTDHLAVGGFNLKFIRSNMSKYMNPTDYPPPGGGGTTTALDNTVFQTRPDHFAFASADPPYNSVCQTCHTTVAHHTQTATDDHQIGNDCTTCHAHSSATEYNAFKPGGHQDTDFGWAGNCQTCHGAGAGAEAVVSVIHANNCDLCHTNPAGVYDKTSNGPGPVANGIDGDAGMAEGAADWSPPFLSTKYTCTTCHDPAGTGTAVNAATYGGIHHDNKNNDIENIANCAVRCHTATNHVTQINDIPNDCNTCHTLTQGTATGAPVAPGDPKVHDACGTCHTLAAQPAMNGKLVPPPGTKGVTVMKTNPANCVDCHTAAKKDMHHTSTLTTSGTCQACHDGTSAAGVNAATAPPQLACQKCHVNINGETGQIVMYSLRLGNANGRRPTKLNNIAGTTAGVTATGVISSHSIAGVTGSKINDYRMCFACHGGTVYTNAIRQAPVITPFHGYPGDLAHGSIVNKVWSNSTPISGYTRKTVLAGGLYNGVSRGAAGSATEGGWGSGVNSYPIDETDGDYLPLIFQFYHAGHRAFKRFNLPGTAEGYPFNLALTARNYDKRSKNQRLYWGNSGHWTVSSNTTHGSNLRNMMDSTSSAWPSSGMPYPSIQPGSEKFGYGGSALETGFTTAGCDGGSSCNGGQWEPKGYTLSFTALYTRFNAGNKPADTTEIPYFTALSAPNDRVFVHSAEVDNVSGDLLVIASNDEGCTLLSVTTQPDATPRGTMTLNGTTGYCELTVISVSPIPDSVDVTSSGTGTPSVNYPVYALVAATANNDTFSAAGSGNTILDVLANDTGTALQIVVGTITGVTQTGGTGTCGTLTPTTNTITYTGGGGTATCTFDYEAQAYDGLTPYGAASTATVTVNQVP